MSPTRKLGSGRRGWKKRHLPSPLADLELIRLARLTRQQAPGIPSPPLPRWDVRHTLLPGSFDVGSGGLNSDTHACKTRTLSTESSPAQSPLLEKSSESLCTKTAATRSAQARRKDTPTCCPNLRPDHPPAMPVDGLGLPAVNTCNPAIVGARTGHSTTLPGSPGHTWASTTTCRSLP